MDDLPPCVLGIRAAQSNATSHQKPLQIDLPCLHFLSLVIQFINRKRITNPLLKYNNYWIDSSLGASVRDTAAMAVWGSLPREDAEAVQERAGVFVADLHRKHASRTA